MKLKAFIFIFISCVVFSSCIKDEGPNLEADIVSFEFKDVGITLSPSKENTVLIVEIADTTVNVKNLVPTITLSENATVTPESGIAQDFSDTVTYTVSSENKQWKRVYKVIAKRLIPMKYDFEEWTIIRSGNYEYPALSESTWSSANSGIALAKTGNVEEFPTHYTTDAYAGEYAAMLKTQRGGKYYGNLVPIFSGSLFRGVFGPINFANFVKSVKFGQPHPKAKGKPMILKGYYKYKVGDVFYDQNDNIIPGRIDECSIYSVMYKVTKGTEGVNEYLDGSNILSSEKIVAKAELQDRTQKSQYTYFELPFTYYEEPDYNRFDYKLALVFASSREGDYYRGAVESTLIVDEVEVICEGYND